jgi:hypothetical protein
MASKSWISWFGVPLDRGEGGRCSPDRDYPMSTHGLGLAALEAE